MINYKLCQPKQIAAPENYTNQVGETAAIRGYAINGVPMPWDRADIYDLGVCYHQIHKEMFLIIRGQGIIPFTVALYLWDRKIITISWSGILSSASDRSLIQFYEWIQVQTSFREILTLMESTPYQTSETWIDQVYSQFTTPGSGFTLLHLPIPIPKLIGQIIIQDRKVGLSINDPPILLSAELILTRQADLETLRKIGYSLGLLDLGQDETEWIDQILQTPITMGADNAFQLEIGKLIRNEYTHDQMLQFYKVIYWDGPPPGNLQDFILSETLMLI